MICPMCDDEGFIIHHYVPFNPSRDYTEDCPLKCEAQQRLRASIDAKASELRRQLSEPQLVLELFDAAKKLIEPKEEGIFKPGIYSPELAALQIIIAKIEGNQ